MFGLLFTIVFGSLVIVLSMTIEPLATHIQRRFHLHPYAQVEWRVNHTLQLQRLAYEEFGIKWYPRKWDIPVTSPGFYLPILDISDEKKPRLRRREVEEKSNLGNADQEQNPTKSLA